MAKALIVNGIHNYTAPEEYIPPKSEAVKEASGMVYGPETRSDDALGARMPARHLRELASQRRRRLMEPGRHDMG